MLLFISPWKCHACGKWQPGSTIHCADCTAERPPTLKDPRSRGFGDTIAAITTAVGMQPCEGCTGRQVWFNERFPYRRS